jgi:hypothetical protein
MQKYSILQLDKHYNTGKFYLAVRSYYRDLHIIPIEYIEQYDILYNTFKDNQLKPNTSVYVTPLSQYPTFKLKNHSEVNGLNIKTTRKIKEIDTLILDHEFITERYLDEKTKTYYIIPHSFLESNFNKYIINFSEKYYGSISESDNTSEYYIVPTDAMNDFISIDSRFGALLQFPTICGVAINSNHGNKKAHEAVPLFCNLTNLINQYNLEIVFDSSLNKEINKDLSVDLDTFKTLFNMLASDDESNYPIAKELISNCDFETSKPYILFLAVLFSPLRNKSSNNKSWISCFTQISKYRDYVSKYFSSRNNLDPTDVDNFVKLFIQDYPQYKQIIGDCLTVYLNFRFKTDLIKEIVIN